MLAAIKLELPSPYFIAAVVLVLIIGITLRVSRAIYMLPSSTAGRRGHPQFRNIELLNLLLGWTVIGWLAAWIWALQRIRPIDFGGAAICPRCGSEWGTGRSCRNCGAAA